MLKAGTQYALPVRTALTNWSRRAVQTAVKNSARSRAARAVETGRSNG